MNTIIALTDFSPAAENAALYAARLARRVDGELRLLHAYQLPITMNDMPVLVVTADELKNNADASLERSRRQLLQQVPDLTIHTESRLGDVNDEVNQLCKDSEPFALVMGTHHYKGLEKVLFGNTALSVIRHCRYPVITVPVDYKATAFNKVVFATDLQPIREETEGRIISVVRELDAELHIVHVVTEGEAVDAEDFLEPFQVLEPQFHTIKSEDVTKGLSEYIYRLDADLTIALPHRHNLMEALFFKLHTRELMEGVERPVMFIRE